MGDVLLDRLVQEREGRINLIRNITQAAADAERDLSEQDRDTITRAQARMVEIDQQLALISHELDMDNEVRDRLARLQPQSVAPATVQYRSAGDLLWDMLHASADRDASHRYNRFVTRAAEHMGTTAANTTPTAGGFAGLLVIPTVGTILDLVPGGRPLLSAMGVQPMPNGWAFMRPRVVDANVDTAMGVQTKEKAELTSKHFDILADNISPVTVGGYLNVSQQLLTFVSQSLDIIVGQMGKRLARYEEKAAYTAMSGAAFHVTLAAGATGAATLTAIYAASAQVYANTGELAQWIAMGPLGWARLGSLVDGNGRQMFPFLGAQNALGTSDASTFAMAGPAGLRSVVTYAIPDDSFYIGNQYGLEAYEYRFPLLETIEPSVLGRQMAVGASLAFYVPTTTEAGPSNTPPAKHETVAHLAP
jgi:HK97 family phage major capsid protein